MIRRSSLNGALNKAQGHSKTSMSQLDDKDIGGVASRTKSVAYPSKPPPQKNPSTKRPWSAVEDCMLKNLVAMDMKRNKVRKWSFVADAMGNRTGKQCRERWHNHLRPDLKKGAWTKEEEKMIVDLQKIFGNQWTMIAERMPHRTDNDIKNRWHTAMRTKAKQKFRDSTRKTTTKTKATLFSPSPCAKIAQHREDVEIFQNDSLNVNETNDETGIHGMLINSVNSPMEKMLQGATQDDMNWNHDTLTSAGLTFLLSPTKDASSDSPPMLSLHDFTCTPHGDHFNWQFFTPTEKRIFELISNSQGVLAHGSNIQCTEV